MMSGRCQCMPETHPRCSAMRMTLLPGSTPSAVRSGGTPIGFDSGRSVRQINERALDRLLRQSAASVLTQLHEGEHRQNRSERHDGDVRTIAPVKRRLINLWCGLGFVVHCLEQSPIKPSGVCCFTVLLLVKETCRQTTGCEKRNNWQDNQKMKENLIYRKYFSFCSAMLITFSRVTFTEKNPP